jgi:hypothetical protein
MPPCHGGDRRFESGRARQYRKERAAERWFFVFYTHTDLAGYEPGTAVRHNEDERSSKKQTIELTLMCTFQCQFYRLNKRMYLLLRVRRNEEVRSALSGRSPCYSMCFFVRIYNCMLLYIYDKAHRSKKYGTHFTGKPRRVV